jgi:hypothetical protein
MSETSISYLWLNARAAHGFRSGVSLHSHTSMSKESLGFIPRLSASSALIRRIMGWADQRSERTTGIRPDYASSFWTPPMPPQLAFEVEQTQIEEKLQLQGLVSLSDHDDVRAPVRLRPLHPNQQIPISLEWTVPFGATAFHLGIHNLPAEREPEWTARMACYRESSAEERPKLLTPLLAELDAEPDVLVIFNHPLWDLYRIGQQRHNSLVDDFLTANRGFLHALELNGLRDWSENRSVSELATRWQMLVISGGDRHGLEPNANVNLTHATSFAEFVYQVRKERISHVLFMPQYAEPWKHRILQSTLDAIRDYPQFPEGSRSWDQRVYAPNASGSVQPLSALWVDGHVPDYIRLIMDVIRLMDTRPVSRSLRFAWRDATGTGILPLGNATTFL